MVALCRRSRAVLLVVLCTAWPLTPSRAQSAPGTPQAVSTAPASTGQAGAPVQPHAAWPTAYPGGSGSALADRISTLLSDPGIAGAHWGIAVTAMDGTPLYGLDEAKLFRPASSAKLFTTAAAMALLGPESSVTTALYGNFDPDKGTVAGDLVLVGAGDPSFGTSDLPYHSAADGSEAVVSTIGARDLLAMTDQLVALGVHAIAGNIVGDATLFSSEAPPEGWSDEDLIWGYGALPNALSFADNEFSVTVGPKRLSEPVVGGTEVGAAIQVEQLVPYLKVNANIPTLDAGSARQEDLQWSRSATDPATLLVNGFVISGHAPVRERLAMADPALYTAQSLYAQLLERKVQIGGRPVVLKGTPPVPQPFLATLRSENPCGLAALGGTGGCAYVCPGTPHSSRILASHVSPPLQQEVVFTLKTSANLHAEVLLHRLGLRNACPGDSTLDGARMARTWLLQTGVADHDFVFYDGSGLSTKDLVTPRAEAQLLAYAATEPWFPQWKAALPVGGVDGTLANRFTQPPWKGHVFAKTGTLGESRALAGYVQTASGHEVIFAILDDNHEPGSAADRVVMDKIVEAIAALE